MADMSRLSPLELTVIGAASGDMFKPVFAGVWRAALVPMFMFAPEN